MNPLNNLLSADQVLLNLEASSKTRAFEQAVADWLAAHLGLAVPAANLDLGTSGPTMASPGQYSLTANPSAPAPHSLP